MRCYQCGSKDYDCQPCDAMGDREEAVCMECKHTWTLGYTPSCVEPVDCGE
ncbi:hypothetical protein [Microvirga ossetica]|uniref:hypothetical protein n=1 Tax=Microvirga ossetica TaxID=1882682 RepID=UPI0012FFFF2A|nr:hypothetical protein [Microvirga ossetica]